jgi:xylulose-5-phosphate/fructose-6-phosphate phosphoketolase
VEGSFRAHQVPLPEAKTDAQELKDLQSWLLSYKPRDLFKEDGSPTKKVLSILPKKHEDRLGQRKITYDSYEPLKLPKWQDYSVQPKTLASCMSTIGEYLDQVVVDNPKAMRIFSPDELVSNKLDAVFRHTGRNFQWDQYSNTKGGRVIEILSEHTCQGFLQGYTLTGRVGLFPSYESFLAIISTMMGQYCKFVKMVCT